MYLDAHVSVSFSLTLVIISRWSVKIGGIYGRVSLIAKAAVLKTASNRVKAVCGLESHFSRKKRIVMLDGDSV